MSFKKREQRNPSVTTSVKNFTQLDELDISWERKKMKLAILIAIVQLFLVVAEASIKIGTIEFLTPDEYRFFENQLKAKVSLCSQAHALDESSVDHEFENEKVDFILVEKKRRRLYLISQGRSINSFRIALGGNPIGDKYQEGDNKTPEGMYFIDFKNSYSDYHLSLRINYPNAQDIEESRRMGIYNPGGDIMIHGLPNNPIKRRLIRHPSDWTRGCMAVTNTEVERIFASVELGTPIEICP